MELRHLRYFVAVAEELHFRRAAERLHIAQPAVSEQVRRLEEDLGVRLFDRTHRSVSLTDAGTALLEEARRVLRHADVARQAARGAESRAMMRIRVGYLADSLPGAVPRALRQLATSAPVVQIHLETGLALRLVEDVRAGRVDAAVTILPAATNGLRVTRLGEQRPVIALPAVHPLATAPAIAFERLAPERVVVLQREVNPAFYSAVAAMCHAAELSTTLIEIPEPRVENVLLAVAAGWGPAVLPESVMERYAMPGIRFVPLEGAAPALQTAVVTHPDNESLGTVAFLRALSRAAQPRLVNTERRLAGVAA